MTLQNLTKGFYCKTCDSIIELGDEQNILLHPEPEHDLESIESFNYDDEGFTQLYCYDCKQVTSTKLEDLIKHQHHLKHVGKDKRTMDEKQKLILNRVIDVNAYGSPLPIYENDLKNVHGLVADKIMSLAYFATIPASGQVYKYEKGVYVDYEYGINTLVNQMIKYSKESNRKEVFNYIKTHSEKSYDDFDRDPNIHNLRNGLLDIETMELKMHTPDYLSLRQFNVDYDPNAKCLEFDKTLEDNLPDIIERQMFLECLAMCLIPEVNFKKAGVFYGPSNAGKSSLISLIERMLGEDNISSYAIQDFDNDRFSCGGLIGKFANITHDQGHEKINHIHKFKNIADHKPVETEKKFGHAQNITHKIANIFLTNHLPEITPEASEGFFSRIVLVEFKQIYLDNPTQEELNKGAKPIDRERIKKLWDELPGIYLKLLNIAKEIKKNQRFTNVISADLIEEQWNRLENPLNWFNEDYISQTFDTKDFVFLDDLYKEYSIQCKISKQNTITQRKFNHYIGKFYIKSDREDPRADDGTHDHKKCLVGIKINGQARHDNLRSNDIPLRNLFNQIRDSFKFGDNGLLICKTCEGKTDLEKFILHKCNSTLG